MFNNSTIPTRQYAGRCRHAIIAIRLLLRCYFHYYHYTPLLRFRLII